MGFQAVPINKYYKFSHRSKPVVSIEEAEHKMKKAPKVPRWFRQEEAVMALPGQRSRPVKRENSSRIKVKLMFSLS